MYHAIPYTFEKDQAIYIDVRSESEFENGHIPGAINLPILYDAERHEVGLIYKNASTDEAKRIGLKYGSEKLHIFYDTLFQLKTEHPNKKIIFYCARGGYRSRSIALLLRSIDVPVFWLQGGYKAYRTEVLSLLNRPESDFPHFIVLNGLTGVGKTHVLESLKRDGQPVLDLEGAANHKGSNLGTIGTNERQTTQNFENQIYQQLMQIDSKYCFVESESRRIGQVMVPKNLFMKMQSGTFILLFADEAKRVNWLINDYVGAENFDDGIRKGMPRIKPYIDPQLYSDLMQAFERSDYEYFTKTLLIRHYDPLYKKSIDSHRHAEKFEVVDYDQCSNQIQNWLTSTFLSQLDQPNH